MAEPTGFLFTQQIIADEDIIDTGIRHNLGFPQFLAGNAFGASGNLHFGDFGDFMGFDMRAVGNACGITHSLHSGYIAFDDIKVDDDCGRSVVFGYFSFQGIQTHHRTFEWFNRGSAGSLQFQQPFDWAETPCRQQSGHGVLHPLAHPQTNPNSH